MRAVRRGFAFPPVALALAVLALSPVVRAQGGDVAAAEALFDAGRTAVEKGDYATACPRFRESERLDPAPGTLLNLADCEEHLGKLARAWQAWKEAVSTLPADDPRLPAAKARERAIEARVPRLTLSRVPGAPEGTVVRKDDVEIHAGSFDVPLPVDPGTHRIVVSAPGREPRTVTLDLAEGESRAFPVEPGPLTVPASPAPLSPVPHAPAAAANAAAPPSPGPWRTIGFLTGVAGVVGVGVGTGFGIAALGDKSTVDANCFGAKGCKQPGVDASAAGRTHAIASDVAFGAGGALLVAGVLLVLTHPPQHAETHARAAVGVTRFPVPALVGRGAGLSLEGAFW